VRDALAPALKQVSAGFSTTQETDVYPGAVEPISEAFRVLQAREAWRAHGGWLEQTQAPLGPAISARFAYARTVTEQQAEICARTRADFASYIDDAISSDAVFVFPTLQAPAPRLSADAAFLDAYRTEAMVFLQVAGLCGLPQITMPAGRSDGAPVGLSIMGPAGSDRALLTLAQRIEISSIHKGSQAL